MESKQLSAFQTIAYMGKTSQINIWLLKELLKGWGRPPYKGPESLSTRYQNVVHQSPKRK